MSRADQSHPLTKAQARRTWLRAQRLDTRAPFGDGPAATAAAVEHLGYVQIDTINVIERSHHHILWSRIPDYRRADLRQAQSVDKSVFEYWTHALSYVPTRDFRFFLPAMRLHRREGHKWLTMVSGADMRKVLTLIRKGGALTIRDIDDDVLVDKIHPWASRSSRCGRTPHGASTMPSGRTAGDGSGRPRCAPRTRSVIRSWMFR